MKSVEEQMKEISRRKKRYERAGKNRFLAITCACLLVSLIAVISIAPGIEVIYEQSKINVLGSTILDAKTGGYVLAALIGFTLGMLATLICRQYRENRSDSNSDPENK
ncbi:MAG: hypothetical protein K5869_06305 [Saccharofermentans sp.]|nr:hypothetical protein [Saccharofermentans sp.]